MVIFKERYYYSCLLRDEKDTQSLVDLENNSATEATIDKLIILKAAKIGFKSIYTERDAQNVDFAKKSIKRMGGHPILFVEKSFTKFDDFFFNGKVLNATQYITKKLGSDNQRYLCNTIPYFQKRRRIKEKCKQHNYADALDCEINNPILYEIICSTTEAPTKQAVIRTPVLIKSHIFKLLAGRYSLKNVGLILAYLSIKISKNTLQRKDGLQKIGQKKKAQRFSWYRSTQKNDKRFCVT